MTHDINIPEFKSEEEESNWLASHQDVILTKFRKAAADGTLTRGTLAKRFPTPTITIRIDPSDIALAKEQALHRGLGYQTYLKMIIHQALMAEARESAGR